MVVNLVCCLLDGRENVNKGQNHGTRENDIYTVLSTQYILFVCRIPGPLKIEIRTCGGEERVFPLVTFVGAATSRL